MLSAAGDDAQARGGSTSSPRGPATDPTGTVAPTGTFALSRSLRTTPCDGCHAGCCRSFAVPISGADAMRLEAAGHDFWEFAARWADASGAIANGYAPHLHFADDPGTPYVLGLLHVESRVFPGTPKCRFLSETDPTDARPLGEGGCGAYDERPAACRVFPKKLDDRGELVQLMVVPQKGREGSEAFNLCPRAWTADDVDPVEAPGEIVAAEFEMGFFAKVAALWNRSPGEWAALPAFLRGVYGRRVKPAEPAGVIPTVEQEADPVILKFPGRAAAAAPASAEPNRRAA